MHLFRQTSWLALSVVWALTVLLVAVIEWPRIEEFGLLNLLVSWNSETTLPALALLLLPAFAFAFPAKRPNRNSPASSPTGFANLVGNGPDSCGEADDHSDTGDHGEIQEPRVTKGVILQSLTIALFSLIASWSIGQTKIEVRTESGAIVQIAFAELPPAYHDEFSYLLQAKTFASKRLAWPQAPVLPDLFHQFHVLNEDATVSRYFPLTGLWIVPSLALGQPIWGHWLAGAAAAVLFFLSARMMMPRRAAFFCGLLIAFSPGLAIFSNMLLAHHPVMLMLAVFLFAFLKLLTPNPTHKPKPARQCFAWAFLAGCGLSAAMLGRPMTAAGFAAPFGAWLLWELIRRRIHLVVIPAFAIPLVAGFVVLGLMNAAATGDPLRTAYQEYTDNFTPRHKFGFNNAVNCEIAEGPMALKKYDQWATNLDWPTAAKNAGRRLKFSLFWTWNLVLLGLGLIAALVELLRTAWPKRTNGWTSAISFQKTALAIVLAAIVSLHAVHLPYWYSGIMEWHYVFETAPLILLLVGFGFSSFVLHARKVVRPNIVTVWACGLVLAVTIPAWFSTPQILGASKVSQWINQTSYSRRRIAEFNFAVAAISANQPALIMVDESGTDPQLSFIINPPDYSGLSLVCRLPRTLEEFATLTKAFPDRKLFYFDANQAQALIQPFDKSLYQPR